MSDTLTNAERREVFLRSRATGFSGVDISATIMLPAPRNRDGSSIDGMRDVVMQLASVQTISFSSYTDKQAARSLGFKNAVGYARGGRTIAGTMIFNQLHQHPFDDSGTGSYIRDERGVLSYSSGTVDYLGAPDIFQSFDKTVAAPMLPEVTIPSVLKRHQWDFSWDQRNIGRTLHPSDMPPFDIIILYVNEFGNIAKTIIYGIELMHESSVVSINDIYTEVTYQYVARDIEYFHAEDWKQTELWRSEVLAIDSFISPNTVDYSAHKAMVEAKRIADLRYMEDARLRGQVDMGMNAASNAVRASVGYGTGAAILARLR